MTTKLGGRMRRLIAMAVLAVLVAGTATACSKKEVLPRREGLAVEVGGLKYTVYITRELNPRDVEDRDYIPPQDAGTGFAYYGVFLQVCNSDNGPTRTPSNDMRILDSQGGTYAPETLPATAVFAYRPVPLERKRCIPTPGSAAFSGVTSGALLVFKLPISAVENRPMDLEISPPATGIAPKRERIELDI
jgi:hypothetical protein